MAGPGAAYCDTVIPLVYGITELEKFKDSIVFETARHGVNPLQHLLSNELGELSDEVRSGWMISEACFAGC